MIREILAGGPWALAQAVGHTPRRSHYADECHLCYEVRAALRAAGRHPEVVAPGQCYAENEAESRAESKQGAGAAAPPAPEHHAQEEEDAI